MGHRESEVMWSMAEMTSAIGKCAGEIGEQGKWMDAMLPYAKRSE